MLFGALWFGFLSILSWRRLILSFRLCGIPKISASEGLESQLLAFRGFHARNDNKMPLPTFRSTRARRQERRESGRGSTSDSTLAPAHSGDVDIKRATKTRKTWILISCLFFFISVIFLILVGLSVQTQRVAFANLKLRQSLETLIRMQSSATSGSFDSSSPTSFPSLLAQAFN